MFPIALLIKKLRNVCTDAHADMKISKSPKTIVYNIDGQISKLPPNIFLVEPNYNLTKMLK